MMDWLMVLYSLLQESKSVKQAIREVSTAVSERLDSQLMKPPFKFLAMAVGVGCMFLVA